MYQEISWVVTLVLVTLLAITFLVIAKNASSDNEEYAPIQKRAYSIRGKSFLLILLVIVPVIGYTLTKMPYPSVKDSAQAVKSVDAIGHQWYWEISDVTAKAGDPVMYKVTSADVNHGFGVYDDDLNVIAQTQAMPGYTNELLVSFPKPGKYRILCLEYCGLAHHAMISEITVTE
jgi:cytochrome c oxidase subunit 2